ncbi:MAG: AAA family ATPase [Candidatus Lokiarchaeota archaeon]|nr:AAA family ATPase [Candidatus Lokiarchaeota archaeon]
MKIIGFCGLPGSGKSSALNAINKIGYIVNMGDVIRDEAKKRGLNPIDSDLGKIAQDLREKKGLGIIARKCIEKINHLDNEIIFIDGLRSMEEVLIFREIWKLPIVAITIDEERRFNRIKERARKDDPESYEELKVRDKRETNFGVRKVIKNADYTVTNNSSPSELKEQTIKLIRKIIEDY